ncbi:hypothetical protein ACK3SF_04855 [Candidatus Nanosalina sp. VS9-1]|uniref:hypothetical protein n=1 Tax=Candidatus Nanosalina sp. VS9-1 TaxID=3388566 RepID=UPI0039DF7432
MQDEVISGYDKAEHYSSSIQLDRGLEADITVFTVYRDAEGDLDEEFQMIEYIFSRDVSRGLEKFRERAEEFSDYRFFPIIGDHRAPSEATVMINDDDRVEVAEFAEELIEEVHSEIGL